MYLSGLDCTLIKLFRTSLASSSTRGGPPFTPRTRIRPSSLFGFTLGSLNFFARALMYSLARGYLGIGVDGGIGEEDARFTLGMGLPNLRIAARVLLLDPGSTCFDKCDTFETQAEPRVLFSDFSRANTAMHPNLSCCWYVPRRKCAQRDSTSTSGSS